MEASIKNWGVRTKGEWYVVAEYRVTVSAWKVNETYPAEHFQLFAEPNRPACKVDRPDGFCGLGGACDVLRTMFDNSGALAMVDSFDE